ALLVDQLNSRAVLVEHPARGNHPGFADGANRAIVDCDLRVRIEQRGLEILRIPGGGSAKPGTDTPRQPWDTDVAEIRAGLRTISVNPMTVQAGSLALDDVFAACRIAGRLRESACRHKQNN